MSTPEDVPTYPDLPRENLMAHYELEALLDARMDKRMDEAHSMKNILVKELESTGLMTDASRRAPTAADVTAMIEYTRAIHARWDMMSEGDLLAERDGQLECMVDAWYASLDIPEEGTPR